MKVEFRLAWRIFSVAALVLFLCGFAAVSLTGYDLERRELILDKVNRMLLRGDLVSAENLLFQEEASGFYKLKQRFSFLRDGRIKLARCRVGFALEKFDEALGFCTRSVSEVRTDEERFFAYYYAALAALNGWMIVGPTRHSGSNAIDFLEEALKIKEDGEARSLLSLLLGNREESEEMKKKKDGEGAKKKGRLPPFYRDDSGEGAKKEKGY